jgi:hypothetical protein
VFGGVINEDREHDEWGLNECNASRRVAPASRGARLKAPLIALMVAAQSCSEEPGEQRCSVTGQRQNGCTNRERIPPRPV